MSALPDEDFAEWQQAERTGARQPRQGDALHACTFEKAGFRSYRLRSPDGSWELLLSRFDIADREPRGVVTISAPGHEAAFGDLDGYVMSRTVSVLGGRNLSDLARSLKDRLGADEDSWGRRLDYLVVRAMRELQGSAGGSLSITGTPQRPTRVRYVFESRVREGRTISLFGPSASGKTTIASGLAVSLAIGREIVPGWMPTGRFVVGVLDWDEGEDEELVRLYAISRAYDLELSGYHYLRASRPLVEIADEVGRWIIDGGIAVLLVSPVNRAIRAAYGDPGTPIFELYEVLREFGTTNILIDHVAGAQVDNKRALREYGSVAKRDAARGSYSIYEQSSEPGSRVVVLRNTKPDALAPRREPQAIRIEFEPATPPPDGVYEEIRFSSDDILEHDAEPTAKRTETQPELMVRLLREHGPLSATDLCIRSGLHADRLRDIARKARDKGLHVNFDATTERWVLTLPDGPDPAS